MHVPLRTLRWSRDDGGSRLRVAPRRSGLLDRLHAVGSVGKPPHFAGQSRFLDPNRSANGDPVE
jgi:hypothetical protein